MESEEVLANRDYMHSIMQIHLIPETLKKADLKDGQEMQTFDLGGVLTVSRCAEHYLPSASHRPKHQSPRACDASPPLTLLCVAVASWNVLRKGPRALTTLS